MRARDPDDNDGVNDVTPRSPLAEGALFALASAAAFGATTPLLQRFGRGAGAFPTATLLYAGAALASVRFQRRGPSVEAPVRWRHGRRLVAVSLAGAVLAPVCLAWGLQRTGGAAASLLLNLEAVFTVFLAFLVYREPIGARVGLALAAMVLGGACLVLDHRALDTVAVGALAVVVATIAWAVDNTLSRPLSELDPTQVVRWKGTLGASLGALATVVLGERWPHPFDALALLACGATGYGLSLRLYLLAQRRIGAGRTGSIFALAPFVGAALAFALGDRSAGGWTLAGGLFFAAGACLHLTETHGHVHTHEALAHEHAHRHDDGHHEHAHEAAVVGDHSHWHRHEARIHEHEHAPDAHHHHRHLRGD